MITQVVPRSQPIPLARGGDDLGSIVRDYGAADLPKIDWVTQLQLAEPRENLTCLPASTRMMKRLVDIVSALVMILLLGPLLLVVAAAIRITSHGPAIYCQTRVGLNRRSKKSADRRRAAVDLPNGTEDRRGTGIDRRETGNFGRLFTIYKFRTMKNDAEPEGAQFAAEDDPRITRLGRLLRRARIDELPQLWNILRGDMSLIGPRPERPEFMKELSEEVPNYLDRLGLKPGLTGVAQVVNGYDNEIEGFRRKIGYDLLYLQNCCFRNDMKIVLRTARVVMTGEGAI